MIVGPALVGPLIAGVRAGMAGRAGRGVVRVPRHTGLAYPYWTAFGVGALAATLIAGTFRGHDVRRITLWIVAGCGACLIPFAFAPVGVTVACFALGGLICGPFIPVMYSLFQSATTTANLHAVLASRSALVMVSTPVGPAIGGPLLDALGASETLATSGIATVALAIAASMVWTRDRAGAPDLSEDERGSLDAQRT